MKIENNTSIINGLARFEKKSKLIDGPLILKGTRVKKNQRTSMAIIYLRLKNNLNNEIKTGVKFTKLECDALGLPCSNEFSIFYLDVNILSKKRYIVYLE